MVAVRDWWLGALAGKLLIAAYAPLAALGLLAAGHRFFTPSAGRIAALIYLATPWIALVSLQSLIDGAFACYLLTALYATLAWQQAAADDPLRTRWLALGGFLAGAAVACKYPAVVYCALPLAAWVAWRAFNSARAAARSPTSWGLPFWSAVLKPLGVFAICCALGCGAWFAKNVALTGNPTYPLLYRVFDGRTRTAEKDRQWAAVHRPPNFDSNDFRGRLAGFVLMSDWISPLTAPLALLAIVGRRYRPLVWGLAGYCGFVFLCWWLFTHRIDRFWVPILPVVTLLAGVGATWDRSRAWRLTIWFVVPLGLLYGWLVIVGGALGNNDYLADLDALRVDRERVEPWHIYLNEHRDEVTGLLLVGNAAPFDLDVPVLYNTVFDDSILEEIVRGHTPAEIHAALAQRHVSHVLVSWREIARYRSPGNYGITDFLQPEVFQRLVSEGVLTEVPRPIGESDQLFRVEPLPGAE